MKPKLLIITGPTATGKTGQALRLAKELGGELVSADSRQCYKHLDIITGKDFEEPNWQKKTTLKERFELGYYTIQGVPVWLYDVLDLKEYFSAFEWAQCAKAVIENIRRRQKVPILVGGSYFYLQTLLYGLADQAGEVDWEKRQALETMTLGELQQRLKKLNPRIYEGLNSSDRQNKRRLVRWIEKLTELKGGLPSQTPLSNWADQFSLDFRGRRFKQKTDLIGKIKLRLEERLLKGALAEVEILLSMGYAETDPGLQTLGYRELLRYLRGELTLVEAIQIWETKELQYAKRQLTFMKKNSQIVWELL